MNPSAGSVLLVNMAALEAILTQCKAIEPEHLFLAMCKASDLTSETIDKIVEAKGDVLQRIHAEIPALQNALALAQIDTARTRRQLRRLLQESPDFQGKFEKHRSNRCREVCQAAESRAMLLGDPEAQPLQFLWAVVSDASPLIQEAVRKAGGDWTRLCDACNAAPAPIGRQRQAETAVDSSEHRPTASENQPEFETHQDGPVRSRTPFLDKFGRDLTRLARDGKLDPCIGRKDEMRAVAQVLARRTKNNPVLVGDAGVGKTCIVEGLALRAAREDAPEQIRDWRIVEISMGSLIAGAAYQGVLEERLLTMIKEAQSDPNLVLFMDELHTLVGAGGSHGRGLDAAQILKPAMARGDIRLIGATTTAEYRKYIESDAALERRLQMIWVNEPSRDEAIEILDGIRPQLERHHNVLIAYDAIVRAVEWSMRYLPDHRLPDKALDIIDQACSAKRMRTLSPIVRDPLETIDLARSRTENITEEDIATAISERSGIPIGSIAQTESDRLLIMEDVLRQRVLGQEEALKNVADTIRTARAGLKKPNRPAAVFLFLGPTGTGKTELAKALAEFLFGTEEALIRLDMSEYREKHNVARLVGAPPGYIGHDEEGQLTGKVRTRPYSVILLDEIEKAHSDVFDIFLQVFDDGRLTDSKGRRAMFTESVIIMTSNLGASRPEALRKAIGFHPHDSADIAENGDADIEDALKKTFRAEFLNRIDRKVVFNTLPKQVAAGILNKLVDRLNAQLADRAITVELLNDAFEQLLDEGFSETYGARELERVFDARIGTPLARLLLEGRFRPGQKVRAFVNNGQFVFE